MKKITMDWKTYQQELAEAKWDGENAIIMRVCRIMGVSGDDRTSGKFKMPNDPGEVLDSLYDTVCFLEED